MELVIVGIVALAIGAAAGWFFGSSRERQQQEQDAANIKNQASAEAKTIVADAKSEAAEMIEDSERRIKVRLDEAEESISRRRKELDREDESLQRRRESLDNRFDDLEKRQGRLEQREQNLNKRQGRLDKRENALVSREEEKAAEFQRIAQMTIEEARDELLTIAERDSRNDMARIIRQVEAEARDEADKRARDIISLAVQRLASEHVSEISISMVPLPGDDMKGRIIGRSGRNIRAFEMAAGVDVIVDDTPEAVTISSFDPVRREVARRAMSKLVTDGRIHPARIEKLVADTAVEVENTIREEGEQAAYVTGIHGLHPEILKLLGKLKFRTSYGQNQHAHAIETANLAGMMAAELGG